MSDHLQVLEISGTPEQRGRVHGEAFRGLIRELLPAYFDYMDCTSRAHGVMPLTKERALAITRTYLAPTKEYAPDLMAEVQGIAEGADVVFDEVMALNAFLDLFDYMSPAFIEAGCTTMMIPGGPDGSGAVIGQNYDLPEIFAEPAVLLTLSEAERPGAVMYTTAGMLGCVGLNTAGIGVVINNLVPADAGPGVPYTFVIRKILEAEQIGDAIDAVVGTRRSSGMNYVLCDGHGEIYGLETSAADFEVLCPFDGPMAHSNHYLAERLKPLERRGWNQRGQSIVRWGRATRLLKRAKDPDANLMKEALCDHVNNPIAICRHSELHCGEACGQTICGVVLEPSENRASFVRGPSCEHTWAEYSLLGMTAAAH
ncbi:MAG: C45 family autoproteolytic acyltransferase/hydrolase [bacterium]|nr:C45 family autoproteolytic acyltransferase/hydrolase [bacterium]